MNQLSAKAVMTLGAGKYEDGAGLRLVKTSAQAGNWVLRFTVHGKRREMGLGSIHEVSLKEARTIANQYRATIREGLDPIKVRDKKKREAARNLHLLKDIARDAFESRKAELKGDGKAGRWFSPLELHVLPRLGNIPVSDIDQTDIRDTFAPIWHDKADTARKAMNRLNICLQHAAALGLDVDLQAIMKAKALLGRTRHRPKNIPAMNWHDVPAFYASLNDGSATHLALRLLILTGVRSNPLRHIHEDQIDGDIWTVPAEAMKGRRDATNDFRVPLSTVALNVIDEARRISRNGFLFTGARGSIISDMTMAKHMERVGLEARPHGFRSSLRDWLAEATDARHDVAETILGHTVGGSVERAYRRTDFIDQRRALMERWAQHVTGRNNSIIPFEKPKKHG